MQTLPVLSSQRQHEELQAFANEGILLQNALQDWESTATLWHSVSGTAEDDQMTLSFILHNAITIYLSGLFDYFTCWDDHDIHTPIISRSEVEDRRRTILSMVVMALKQTTLAGILFMFPLRVVGARAETVEQRSMIAGLLEDISKKGFVVAGAIVADLKDVWEHRSVSH